MIDFEAICDALAARFLTGTLGGPAGLTAMRTAYSETPKNVPVYPVVVLEVKDGEMVANPGQWKHEMHVDVVFCLSKRMADPARTETQRRKWLPYLLGATKLQFKLGLGSASGYSVDKAIPTGWEFEEFEVAGDTTDAIRVPYSIFITETVELVP